MRILALVDRMRADGLFIGATRDLEAQRMLRERLEAALPSEQFSAQWAEGRGSTLDDMIAVALDELAAAIADRRMRLVAAETTMQFGAHLPLMDFGGHPLRRSLTSPAYAPPRRGHSASTMLTANDHLVFDVAVARRADRARIGDRATRGSMTLATTVSLPVVRGPGCNWQRPWSAVDLLSGGRQQSSHVGPGSSARDYKIDGRRLRGALEATRRIG